MLNKWRLIQVNPERCCLLTDGSRRGRGKCRRCHGNELYAVLTEYFSPASTYGIHASIRDPGPSNSFYFTDHTQPSLMTDAVSEALIDSQDPGRHTRTRVLLLFLSVIVKNIQHVSIVSCSTALRKKTKLSKDFYKTKTAVRPTVTTVTIFIPILIKLTCFS